MLRRWLEERVFQHLRMEELKRKLEFDSPQMQCQTLKTICDQIKKRKNELVGESGVIIPGTAKIAELELLWEKTRDGPPQLSELCAHCLIELWDDAILDFDYVLKGFTNLLPTSSCMHACVNAVGKILLLVVKKALYGVMGGGEDEVMPESRHLFFMNTQPHPFISMYRSRVDCWSSLLQVTTFLLSQDDDRLTVEILHILKPFLKFVLLNPAMEPKQGVTRVLLSLCLTEPCRANHRAANLNENEASGPSGGKEGRDSRVADEVASFLLECLPCLQISTPGHVTEAVHTATAALGIIASNQTSVRPANVQRAVHHCLSLAHQLRELGMDMSPALRPLSELDPVGAEIGDSATILMLGDLLYRSSVWEQQLILKFVQKLRAAPRNGAQCTGWKNLIFPLIQIMSSMYGKSHVEFKSMEISYRKANRDMAHKLLREIINEIDQSHGLLEGALPDGLAEEILPDFGVNEWHCTMCAASQTSARLLSNVNAALRWLGTLQARMHDGKEENVSEYVMQLVVAILFSFDYQLAEMAVTVCVDIAAKNPPKAYNLLPLFMYIIRDIRYGNVMYHTMKALPQLACHRYIIAHVTKLILNRDLGPFSLKLVTDLWKKQDRVFAILQNLLSEFEKHFGQVNPDTGLDEILLEVAVCTKEVCAHRPEQHGKDVLPTVSKIINTASSPENTEAYCIALDALISVIRAEEVDLLSAYNILERQFQHEERPCVIAKWCEFFSLVPEVGLETKNYEDFTDRVVKNLWHLTLHPDHRVVMAAMSALSEFKADASNLEHLPAKATAEVREKRAYERRKRRELRAARGEEVEEEEEEEEEDLSIPGCCYINLLTCVEDDALPGVEDLLESFMSDELEELPRRVYSQSFQRQGPTEGSESKVIGQIPSAITHRSANNKQPALKHSYAAGQLMCFEPGSDRSRGSRAVRQKGRAQSQLWLDTLSLLLAELPVLSSLVSPSDWLYVMQLPKAWHCFMARALLAVIEGRRAEVEMAQSRARDGPDEESGRVDMATAWLWARDKLGEQLRTTVLKNSGARGNAILALAGLASAVSDHSIQLGEEAISSGRMADQYEGHKSWMTRVTDSLMVAMDTTYNTQSLFGWCKASREGDHSNTNAAQTRCCAVIGLSLLVPHLLGMDTSHISGMIDRLIPPTISQAPPSIPHSIGAGLFLARLCQEHYTDMMGAEGENVLLRAFDRLETVALGNDDDNDNQDEGIVGCTLGLAVALAGLSQEGSTHARVHLSKVKDDILGRIRNTEGGRLGDACFQARVVCGSLVTAACYQVNRVTPQEAFQTASMLQGLVQNNSKSVALAVSAGVLAHSLARHGHPDVMPLVQNQHSIWMRQADDQDSSSETVKSAAAGLVCLMVGAGHLIWTDQRPDADHQRGALHATAKSLCQLLTDTSDLKLLHSLPWLLGYLHMGLSGVTENRSSVPSKYAYLSESSLLRAGVDLLLEAGRQGSAVIPSLHVTAVLRALHACSENMKKGLPPLNWAVVLNPIMRNASYADGTIYEHCMRLAVGQCDGPQNPASLSTANFVAAWMTPPLYQTIQESCEMLLFQSLSTLTNCLPLKKLEAFISNQIVGLFQQANPDLSKGRAALHGLKSALQIRDPPQGVVNLLTEAVKQIFTVLPLEKEYQCLLFSHLGDCIKHVSWENQENMTSPLTEGNLLKGTFVRAYLVRQGLHPPDWLVACVDEVMTQGSDLEHDTALWFLLTAFTQTSSRFHGPEKLSWLMNLINFIKNLAFRRDSASQSSREPHERISFLFDVFTVTIVAWSSQSFPLLCGPHPHHYDSGSVHTPSSQSAEASGGEEEPYSSASSDMSLPDWLEQVNGNSPLGCGEGGRQVARDVKRFLPGALCSLLKQYPSDLKKKVLDWLINLCMDSSDELVSKAVKIQLRGCLYASRHFPEFREDSRWLKVFNKS